MSINGRTLFQIFKYAIYVFLAMNVYWFFAEEAAAATLQFADGVSIGELIEAYSATIDTAAWVVLLLMFELETSILDDRQFTKTVTYSLHSLRALCYAFIVYAFYGYVTNADFLYEATLLESVRDACTLVPDAWSWAADLDEYVSITTSNCSSLSTGGPLYQLRDMLAVVDAQGLQDIRYLAWVDVINAAVWLLVVLVLEIDVRLQERNRFEGLALRISSASKVVLYSLLLLAALYWGVKGDFVDFWDAFLWLVAFIFIEKNVFDWRREELAEMAEA